VLKLVSVGLRFMIGAATLLMLKTKASPPGMALFPAEAIVRVDEAEE
jgi:hypothetical protein